MKGPQTAWLADGRLHLHHGPIDLIIECNGAGAPDAYAAAVKRFETILPELAEELPALRAEGAALFGPVARRMAAAVRPFASGFITPMAAVAGAVADEVIHVIASTGARRAYVNNGGDVSLLLSPGEHFTAVMPHGRARIGHETPVRGVATSGWRGRSWSFGIADSVTVLARTAAMADAAATMIANAVDLPDHPAIERRPARELSPDSDLGARAVTTAVGPLSREDAAEAVAAGADYATALLRSGLIHAAVISMNDACQIIGDMGNALNSASSKEPEHA